MLTKIKNKYFGDRAFYRKTLSVALPIMIQNGITNFVGMLDNIMVGRVGTEQMTGVAIVNQLLFVFNLMLFGAVSGAGIFGAQFFGKGDKKGVQETFRFKLISCAFLTCIGASVFILFGSNLIRLYLTGEGNIEDIEASFHCAKQYLSVMLVGYIPFFLTQAYSSTLRETGETLLPMKAGITAVFLNLILNTLLIFGLLGFPRMGAVGAALATVISRFVEAFIVMFSAHFKKKFNSFFQGVYHSLHVEKSLVVGIIKKGFPLIINETLWAFSIALLNQCYSIRSYDVVSAVNISSTISNVFSVSFIAMGNAIGILIGHLLGAGKKEEAIDANRKLTVFSVLSCTVFAAILCLTASYFPLIYVTTSEIRSMATKFIIIMACCMPIGAYANACYFTLRSGGKTMVTVLFDSCYAWIVVVPFAFCLSRFTAIPIIPLFLCCQLIELGKCIIGFFMIRSGIWIQKIVR